MRGIGVGEEGETERCGKGREKGNREEGGEEGVGGQREKEKGGGVGGRWKRHNKSVDGIYRHMHT